VDKSLGEWGEKVPQADREELDKVNAELKEALADQEADADKLRGAHESVMKVFERIGSAMHQQAQAEGAGPATEETASPAESDDDVVEGEIVEDGGDQ